MLADRIAKHLPLLPAPLRALLDSELAAGSTINNVEIGRGEHAGRIAFILEHPFRTPPAEAPSPVLYREQTDSDPMFFEFYLDSSAYSLVTGKFKPSQLPPPIQGPLPPPPRQPASPAPSPPPPDPIPRRSPASDAARRFFDSMNLDYERWREGTSYDLAALADVTPDELARIQTRLINRDPLDWRDIEALAAIDTPEARAAVVAALKHPDIRIRREARKHATDDADDQDRARQLIATLQSADLFSGLSQAIDEAQDFHPPQVIRTLLDGALNRDGQAAVHFAALLCYLHGKAAAPFDWSLRPFFLRFHTENPDDRIAAFNELCTLIGADASQFHRTR
jgi:hypothetical protein